MLLLKDPEETKTGVLISHQFVEGVTPIPNVEPHRPSHTLLWSEWVTAFSFFLSFRVDGLIICQGPLTYLAIATSSVSSGHTLLS